MGLSRFLLVAFGSALVACGSSGALPDSRDASPPSEASATSAWGPLCPATLPTFGSSCSPSMLDAQLGEYLECEYGYTPGGLACSSAVVQCVNGQWAKYDGLGSCTPHEANPSSCPADFASVPQGASCTPPASSCYYDASHVCACLATTEVPGPSTWVCIHDDPGCPPERPRVGSACTGEGSASPCAYDDVCGTQVMCLDGVWLVGPGGC